MPKEDEMKFLLALIVLFHTAIAPSFAQDGCPVVYGETELESYYNDVGNNLSKTCKAVLTDGKCLRVQASAICPGGTVTKLNEAQSATVFKQYLYEKQKNKSR